MPTAARLISVALTVLAAWFAARGIGAAVLQAVGNGVDLAAGAAPADPPAVREQPALHAAEARSALDGPRSTERDAPPRRDPAPQPARDATDLATAAPLPCALPIRTIALVAEAGAADGRAAPAYQVGDHLDDAVVTRIGRDRLFLRRGDGSEECYLDIRRPRAAPAPGLPD